MRTKVVTCLILCGFVCAGCATDNNRLAYQAAPIRAPDNNRLAYQAAPIRGPEPAIKPKEAGNQRALATQIPWQLTPASTASEAQGERTSVRYVRAYGRVRGTDVALANIAKPMTAYPGPHAAVQPCRRALMPQATRIGAYSVQAAAAGPQRQLSHGAKQQQVFFRIFYRNADGIEVRQAALVCTLNVRGTVIAAKPV